MFLHDCPIEAVLELPTPASHHHGLLVWRTGFESCSFLCQGNVAPFCLRHRCLRAQAGVNTLQGIPLSAPRAYLQCRSPAPGLNRSLFDYLFSVSRSYGGCKRCCRRCSSRCRISERQVLGGQRESPSDHLRPGKSCGCLEKVSCCLETCGQELHPHPLIY